MHVNNIQVVPYQIDKIVRIHSYDLHSGVPGSFLQIFETFDYKAYNLFT